MSYLFSIIPLLAASLGDGNAGLFRVFRAMRRTALGSASGIVSLVMGIACIIIVIKLIKLTYDMESDEQQAGFGGVTLWQVVRPVVVLFALSIYPVLISTIDSVADTLSTSIVKAADKMDKKAILAAEIALVDAVSSDDKDKQQIAADVQDAAKRLKESEWNMPLWRHMLQGGVISFAIQGVHNAIEKGKTQDELIEITLDRQAGDDSETELLAKEERERKKAMRRAFSAYYKNYSTATSDSFELKNPATWIPGLCNIIYDFAFIIIECGAEIVLCILCFAGPVVLTITLIDSYKHAFMEFVMRYFQFSFWKVVAAIINWAVNAAVLGAATVGLSDNLNEFITAATGAESEAAGAAAGHLWVSSLIALAGIFCFSKIGELAAYFIPVNGGGMAAGAGAALAAGAGAAGAASSGAQKLAGAATGAQARGVARQQQNSMNQIAGGVSSIQQSLEGSKVSREWDNSHD